MNRSGPTLLVLLLLSSTGAGAELAKVRFDEHATVGGQRLSLNGIGLRKKMFFDVYVAGLYLAEPARNGGPALAANAPKALVMEFLRDVDRKKLAEAYWDGFVANNPAKAAQLRPDIERFLATLSDARKGDRISFTYDPSRGSTITAPNGRSFMVGGKDFADLYLGVFLGPNPPTESLKDGLLGQISAAND